MVLTQKSKMMRSTAALTREVDKIERTLKIVFFFSLFVLYIFHSCFYCLHLSRRKKKTYAGKSITKLHDLV